MLDKKTLKKKKKHLTRESNRLEEKEESFYGQDNRFEKIYLLSGVLVLAFLGATFWAATSGQNSRVVSILFGMGLLQILVGGFFTLGLLRKKGLHKSLFSAALILHISGVVVVVLIVLADSTGKLLSF